MFLDASEKAYSVAIYLRNEYTDGTISVRLVAAKTRLAPLKTISIPRLELTGAVITFEQENIQIFRLSTKRGDILD